MVYYGIKEENLQKLQVIIMELPHRVSIQIEQAIGQLQRIDVKPETAPDVVSEPVPNGDTNKQ